MDNPSEELLYGSRQAREVDEGSVSEVDQPIEWQKAIAEEGQSQRVVTVVDTRVKAPTEDFAVAYREEWRDADTGEVVDEKHGLYLEEGAYLAYLTEANEA